MNRSAIVAIAVLLITACSQGPHPNRQLMHEVGPADLNPDRSAWQLGSEVDLPVQPYLVLFTGGNLLQPPLTHLEVPLQFQTGRHF